MSFEYVNFRNAMIDTLSSRRAELANGRYWTIDTKLLRFKHGESIAELKIPFNMGVDDEACIEKAALSLLTMILKRNEYTGPERRRRGEDDESPVQPLPGFTPALKERSYRIDTFITDSVEQQAAIEILSSTANIDTAMLTIWLGGDGHGRKFIKLITDIFDKALKEEAKLGGEETTTYLALLAVTNTIRKKRDKIKEFRVKGIGYEKIDHAIGIALFCAFRLALSSLFTRLEQESCSYYNAGTAKFILSSIVPKQFLAIPSNIMTNSLNPYNITIELADILSKHVPLQTDTDAPTQDVVSAALSSLKKNDDEYRAIKQHCEMLSFRGEVLKYLNEMDMPGFEAHDKLYELYNDDRQIKIFLSNPESADSLIALFDKVKERHSKDMRRSEIVSNFQRYLGSFKKSLLSGFFKSDKKELTELINSVLLAYIASRFDDLAESFISRMRICVSDRRLEFDSNTLLEEYNRGRLYRFSSDDRPIIKTLAEDYEGQLFIDMKDFTKRTLKVKEIAMADFMKEYFYMPILSAASKYSSTSQMAKDENVIRLTNIPGDAAIFSGGIANLVALARDLQKLVRQNREQFLKKLPPTKNEEALEQIHKRFEAKRAELKEKRAQLIKNSDRKEAGIEAKLLALGEEEHMLENTYRNELETAVNFELEAGLYISYGAKAEITILEPKAEFSGTVKVSVGEKINEAARGTARNSLVRAKIELQCENERIKKNNKGLKLPFDIYIDRLYNIKMPPELEPAFEKFVTNRKAVSADAMTTIMSNEFLNDLRKIASGEPFTSLRLITSATDMHNKGQAISEAAFRAYMKETKGTKFFFYKSVEVADLSPFILENFYFNLPTIEFTMSYENIKGAETIDIFRKAGEIVFKGFESDTPIQIYEMLNSEGDFYKALTKNHFQEWMAEAKAKAAESAR